MIDEDRVDDEEQEEDAIPAIADDEVETGDLDDEDMDDDEDEEDEDLLHAHGLHVEEEDDLI